MQHRGLPGCYSMFQMFSVQPQNEGLQGNRNMPAMRRQKDCKAQPADFKCINCRTYNYHNKNTKEASGKTEIPISYNRVPKSAIKRDLEEISIEN